MKKPSAAALLSLCALAASAWCASAQGPTPPLDFFPLLPMGQLQPSTGLQTGQLQPSQGLAQVAPAPAAPVPVAPVAPASAPAVAPAPGTGVAAQPAAPAPAAATAPPTQPTQSAFLGQNLPFMNPANEVLTWDGKNWNINNNRLFQGRFEKYLNAPEETSLQDKQYQAIIGAIMDRLAPRNLTTKTLDEAFLLLPRASAFDIDARLCEALADAVYSAWRAQDARARLTRANESLEQERKQAEWNTRVASSASQLGTGGYRSSPEQAAQVAKEQEIRRAQETAPYTTRLAEVMTTIKANQAKKELSSVQSKIEFQALLVQLFLQRRFQHVLIGTRFYRAVFADADTRLEVGKDTKDLFSRSTGMPPTVGTMDSLANEALRDVREGVQAFQFLLKNNELESASKRLAEAFSIGEYLPEIRTLPRVDKRQALEFSQKSFQLISALEVKDYGMAERLVKELQPIAKDFDTSKPTAAIETARTVSALHLAKARNAAVSGDRATLETELRSATELWPRNPALAEISGAIFSQGDVQQKALLDFDTLVSQHNYRQIYDDRLRFIAASANFPERQEQLKKVLANMQEIEMALLQANEIQKRGDFVGAWEALERKFKDFPDDSKLNQLRAELTTEAAEFVHTLRRAEQLEKQEQVGSSLAWFLKAQREYPTSGFAQDGVTRMVKKVLPES